MARVLVAEDDASVRDLLVETLAGLGYDVSAVERGTEAISRLASDPPDVLVLDLGLPVVDGFGVLRARRQRGLAPSTRIIAVTGKVAERDRLRAWDLGVDDFVLKPIDPMAFAGRVESAYRRVPGGDRRRNSEMQRAHLLDRVEAAFSRPNIRSRA